MVEYKKVTEYKIRKSGQKWSLCKVVDCKNETRAKKEGFCSGHYKIIFNICTSKCKEKALDDGSGKCEKHRGIEDLNINKELKYKILPSGYKQRLCIIKDCDKSARKGGFCASHTNKELRFCKRSGCKNMTDSKFCEKHKFKICIYPECTEINKDEHVLCVFHYDKYFICEDCDNILLLKYETNKKCDDCYKKHTNNIKMEKELKEKQQKERDKISYIKYRNNNLVKCKESAKKSRNKNPINALIKICKQNDKIAKRDFNIDEKYINKLIKDQENKCHYCKHIFIIETGYKKISQMSIDRINNKEGHIIGNCQLVCLFCNFAKCDSNEIYFNYFIEAIKKNKITEEMKEIFNKFIKYKQKISNIIIQSKKTDICKKFNTTSISKEELIELYEEQNGCCAITGLPFYNVKEYKFPFKMSLDRIDNSKGHTKDNCQLVLLSIQFGKNEYSNEEVKKYIEEIRKCN